MKEKIKALLTRCQKTEGPVPVTEAELKELEAAFAKMDHSDPAVRNVMRYLYGRLVLLEETE